MKMKQFDQGWWNCFITYTNEMSSVFSGYESIAESQLKAAGVTEEEIKYALDNLVDPDDKAYEILNSYECSRN